MPELPQLAVDPVRGRKLLLLALATAGVLSAPVFPSPARAASASSASLPSSSSPSGRAVAVSAASASVRSAPAPDRSASASVGYPARFFSPSAALAQDAGRVPALRMPVAGPVVRGFEARAGPYGPGHRGIDIAVARGERVWAPAAGRVVFAGRVAGTAWVSLLVAPEVVVTVGPILDPAVTPGQQVRVHTPVGRLGPGHEAAAVAGWVASDERAALHLSVRVDGVYVDPLAYLVDRPRPRLAPLAAPGGLPAP